MTSYPAVQRLAVPVAFYSVVVRRDAVAKRFPAGTDQFDRTFKSTRGNAHLTLLVSMSMDDASVTFGQLEEAGLVPGEDMGLVDMHQGVLLPCHGIRAIADERSEFVVEWSVQADESYRYGPEDAVLVWGPLSPPEPVVVPDAPAAPQVAKGSPWVRHVPRGGGLVHWTGGDDDE